MLLREKLKQAARLYLWHLVFQRHSQDATHHTKLAILLLDDVLSEQAAAASGPTEALPPAKSRQSQLRAQLRELLLVSDLYDTAKLCQRLLQTNLHEEQVVVLEKVGPDRQASAALRTSAGFVTC